MERKIGEIFEYNGEWYQCVESDSCGECSLRTTECGSGTKSDLADKVFGQCSKVRRTGNKHVIFKKLEKVGEPYEYFMQGTGIILVQEYILASQSYICGDEVIDCQKDGRVAIEIKQTKEDMEEKKLNLKPFDIQKAREGKPVCTRDGRKARIICFDVKAKKSIAALITNDDTEEVHFYYDNGRSDQYQEYRYDLMMLPEKKEGWVNVYKDGLLDTKSYPTKKEAFDKASPEDYVDTVKINWSE
mgnify:CR=1 FL=1